MICGQCFVIILAVVLMFNKTISDVAPFRILAPQFICPIDENTPVEKPDNVVITLQTAAGADFPVTWSVRWTPLPTTNQRLTIMLWKATRALEAHLNRPPKEPYVYIIENNELLHGIDYIFHVSSLGPDGTLSTPKSFHIDNTYGNQKLDMIEGRADLLSIVLIGWLETFADVEFVLDAQITACFPTQDYYFLWTIRSAGSQEQLDVSNVRGSRLRVPPYSLQAGASYDANCEVVKESTGYRITQIGLPFQVIQRNLEVFLNVDYLEVPVNKPFYIEAIIIVHNYQEPINFKWDCKFDDDSCNFGTAENGTLSFPSGLLNMGQYVIKVTANVMEKSASATATLTAVENSLPVIQVIPMHRVINEGSQMYLVANASNVAPTCTLTWYFANEEVLTLDSGINSTFDQHGEPLSDTVTIYSLEEVFLNELTDFTNETEWRQVTAEMAATSGRARFVAECGCSMTFQCETKGMVYADVNFKLNQSPKPGEIMISPDSGTALETVFRISSLAVVDPDTPLRYSFYCRVDNGSMLLGSFMEHRAVETFLPYMDGGTELWVEVCDVLGACSTGVPFKIQLEPGNGATMETFLNDVQGHLKRCEMMYFNIDVMSAVITYMNTNQSDILLKFTTSLLEILANISEGCVNMKHDDYSALLKWLDGHGFDTSGLRQLN